MAKSVFGFRCEEGSCGFACGKRRRRVEIDEGTCIFFVRIEMVLPPLLLSVGHIR